MSTLKTKKTASRTGTLGERMGGDNLENPGQHQGDAIWWLVGKTWVFQWLE